VIDCCVHVQAQANKKNRGITSAEQTSAKRFGQHSAGGQTSTGGTNFDIILMERGTNFDRNQIKKAEILREGTNFANSDKLQQKFDQKWLSFF